MKNILTLSILLVLSLSTFAKTFYTYTAKKSGNWANAGTWNIEVRNDNVQKDKFIIPSPFTIVADENVNTMGFTDVELQISGTLKLGSSTNLYFGTASKIEILSTGAIDAEGASQQIFIGGNSKYIGNSNKTLKGPLYADVTTGIAPNGFIALSMLPVNFISFTVSTNNDNTVSLKWATAEEKNHNHFEIEQSFNGNSWTKIGTVAAIINNNAVKTYSFIFNNTSNGFTAFRLKQIDNDGKSKYSAVVTLKNNDAHNLANIFAANKNINIAFNGEVKSTVAVKVLNMNGDVVASQSFNHVSSTLNLNMSQLNNGFYIVAVTGANNTTVKKVSIN